jgi:hypothetical protein
MAMAEAIRPLRALTNYLLGEDDQHSPPLPDGLSPDLSAVIAQHVEMLVEFQNTEYAALYLDRLGRFHDRYGISSGLFREIADLLALRMSFNDPIRVAQIVLRRAPQADPVAGRIDPPNGLYRPEIREIVEMLPRDQAESLADGLMAIKMLRGRLRIHVDRGKGPLLLRLFVRCRRLRPSSLRFVRENSSVERWLHMIDRSLAKCPDAVAEVVRSAAIVSGYGASYHLSLTNWNLAINKLAKPVFDGELDLPQLPAALAQVRSAAGADLSGEELRRVIADVLTSARPVTAAAASRPV